MTITRINSLKFCSNKDTNCGITITGDNVMLTLNSSSKEITKYDEVIQRITRSAYSIFAKDTLIIIDGNFLNEETGEIIPEKYTISVEELLRI